MLRFTGSYTHLIIINNIYTMVTTDKLQQPAAGMSIAPATKSNNLTDTMPFAGTYREYLDDLAASRFAPYRINMEEQYEEPTPILTIDSASVCTPGNLSAIVGAPKSKKTFLTTALIGSMLAWRKRGRAFENVGTQLLQRVLWLDTEQSKSHVRKVVERLHTIIGYHPSEEFPMDVRLTMVTLRELEPQLRLEALVEEVELLRPSFVVVDGIADLQRNTNDLEESDRLVNRLMALSTLYDCHILCVLHANPGTDKARGHLGSSLQRKAETVIYVHKVGERSIVEPQFCRNEPFERFAFMVGEEGIPILAELPEEGSQEGDRMLQLIRTEYGGVVERSVLAHKLREVLGLGRTAALMRIARALRSGRLVEEEGLVRLPDVSCHAVTLSQGVTPVTPVTPVTEEEECPF